MLDYSADNSVPLKEDFVEANWISKEYKENPMLTLNRLNELEKFENLLPARISKAAQEFAEKVDVIAELA